MLAHSLVGSNVPVLVVFTDTDICHSFDLLLAGRLSFGLTSVSHGYDTQTGSSRSLKAYTDELCAFCCSIMGRQFKVSSKILSLGSVAAAAILQNPWVQNEAWQIARTAFLIFSLMLASECRRDHEEEALYQRLTNDFKLQKLTGTSSMVPFVIAAVTDLRSGLFKSLGAIQNLSRMLFVMNTLSSKVQWRLDKFFYFKLSRRRLQEAGDDLVLTNQIDGHLSQTEELADMLEAIWTGIPASSYGRSDARFSGHVS
jgi:hypothetical protein